MTYFASKIKNPLWAPLLCYDLCAKKVGRRGCNVPYTDKEAELASRLKDMAKNAGLRDTKSFKIIQDTPLLCSHWSIGASDGFKAVFVKAKWQLEQLIDNTLNDEQASIARLFYNVPTDHDVSAEHLSEIIKLDAGPRFTWLHDRKLITRGYERSRTIFREEIIPLLISGILSLPPIPTPHKILAAAGVLPADNPTLEQSEATTVTQRQPERSTATTNPYYIPREKLHAEFMQAVSDGVRLIVLYGPAGMGKSSLARAMIRELPTPFVPEVDIDVGRIVTDSLVSALERCEIDITRPVTGNEEEYLARLLAHNQKHPRYILIDNLESTDDLIRMRLPNPNSQSIIIATCRYKGKKRPEGCAYIHVHSMEANEAKRMILKRVDHAVGGNDAERLADELGNYPLVISFACILIVEQRIKIDEFCRDVRADAAYIARRTETEEGSTLLAVIRRTVALVKVRDQLAYVLMAFMALAHRASIVPVSVLRMYARFPQSDTFTETAFKDALRVLCDFSILVDIPYVSDEGSVAEPTVREYYWMHSLVHQILAVVLEDETLSVVGRSLGLFVYSMQLRAAAVTDYPDFEQDVKQLSTYIVQFIGYVVLVLAPGDENIRALLRKFPFIEGQLAVMLLSAIRYIPDPPQLEYDWGYALPEWYQWAERRVVTNPTAFHSLIAKAPINGLWLAILGVQLPPREHLDLAQKVSEELEGRIMTAIIERWGAANAKESAEAIEFGDASEGIRNMWLAANNDELQVIILQQRGVAAQEIKEAQLLLSRNGDVSLLPPYLAFLARQEHQAAK